MPRLRRYADRLTAPFRTGLDARIFFVHLPKCGGTSINRAVARHYPPPLGGSAPVFSLSHRSSHLTAEALDLSIDTVRDTLLRYALNDPRIRFVTGHFRISRELLDRHADAFAFTTLLRHPVQRWISHYFFDRYRPDRGHVPIEEDLPTFLVTHRARRFGTVFVRRLGGLPNDAFDDAIDNGEALDEAVGQACANLDRLACVGVLEHLPDFLRAFETRFGARLRVPHANPNPVARPDRERALTPEIMARIEACCRPDLTVYRHALDRLGLPQPTPPAASDATSSAASPDGPFHG